MNIESLVTNHVWLMLLIWLAVYAGDYYLTIIGARRFRAVHPDAVGENSYELTPGMEDDIDRLKLVSGKFLLRLFVVAAAFVAAWSLTRWANFPRGGFLFAYGLAVLKQLPVLVRHARNLALYADSTPLTRVPRWVSLRASGVELIGWGVAFLFLAGLSGSWTMFGGAASTLLMGHDQWRLGLRKRRAAEGDATLAAR